MNRCEFCNFCWTMVLIIGAMYGAVHFLNWVGDSARDTVCFEAKLDQHHLDNCDKSAYPVAKK